MFKEIFGFDPEVFEHGTTIRIEDNYIMPQRNQLLIERNDDYFKVNITGNYIVNHCYVTELILINAMGEQINLPLKYINGENPRIKITLLSK